MRADHAREEIVKYRLDYLASGSYAENVSDALLDPALDQIFHALSDSGRRTMVKRLSHGPASVTELGKPLAMTLAAVLQHVQVLEECGLVRSEKLGRTRTCTLNTKGLWSAERWIAQRRSLVERRLDRLEEHLTATTGRTAPSRASRSRNVTG